MILYPVPRDLDISVSLLQQPSATTLQQQTNAMNRYELIQRLAAARKEAPAHGDYYLAHGCENTLYGGTIIHGKLVADLAKFERAARTLSPASVGNTSKLGSDGGGYARDCWAWGTR
jgi:hypothetical protein